MPASRLGALVVAVVTAAAFAPALGNGWVDFDDQTNFLDNAQFRGLAPANLWWMLTTTHLGPWQPLSWLTLALDHAVWGLDARGYHLTNIAWHVANALLFHRLARRLLLRAGVDAARAEGAAVFGALFWAVHPLRVESVAWVTERRDLVAGCFVLLTLLVYVGRPGGPRPLAVACAALALLGKANAMAVPALLIVLDMYPLRRLGGAIGWTTPAARRVWLEKLPFVVLAVMAGAIALVGQERAGALRPLEFVPLRARAGAAAYQLGFYLWKSVVPVGLLPVYEFPASMALLAPRAVASAVAFAAVLALGWRLRHRVPALLAVAVAYAAALAPTLGLVQSGPQLAADRFTYLALLGWSVLLGAIVVTGSRWRALLASAVVAVLAVLTALQTATWHDARTLWTRAVAVAPDNAFAHFRMGEVAARAGDAEASLGHLREAVRLKPQFPEAQNNLAVALAARGAIDEALAQYREAIRANPRYAFAYTSMGTALEAAGRIDEALAAHRQAIAVDPALMEAHGNLGALLDQLGRPDEALVELEAALRLRPSAEVLNNLGVLLVRQGKPAEAAVRYREAAALRSDIAVIQVNLAEALRASGDVDGARRALETALRLDPAHAAAQAALAALEMP